MGESNNIVGKTYAQSNQSSANVGAQPGQKNYTTPVAPTNHTVEITALIIFLTVAALASIIYSAYTLIIKKVGRV